MLTEAVATQWQELLSSDEAAAVRVADKQVDDGIAADLAESHSRRLLMLDLQDSESEHEILAAVARAFGVDPEVEPDWDVLDDTLGDYEVSPEEGLLVVLCEWESLVESREETLATIVDVLRTAARDWEDEGVPWLILVSGEGPSFGLPWVGPGTAPWLKSEEQSEELDGIEIEDALEQELVDDSG